MNFTLALLAGLVLLLPGITALVAWNVQGATQGAKRPELQLTSVTALFLALGAAILLHVMGFALISLIWASLLDLGQHWPHLAMPIIDNPYEMALGLALGDGTAEPGSVFAFFIVTLGECILSWRLIASPGFDLILGDTDVRTQGWVYQHIVRPSRYGFKPIAYILTNPAQGEYGIGYQGVVADVRQGDNGELKAVSLAQPERFVYQLAPATAADPPRYVQHDRQWIGGVVALDATVIRNIVVQSIPGDLIAQVAGETDPSSAEDSPQ